MSESAQHLLVAREHLSINKGTLQLFSVLRILKQTSRTEETRKGKQWFINPKDLHLVYLQGRSHS